jgi:hypothetical protein
VGREYAPNGRDQALEFDRFGIELVAPVAQSLYQLIGFLRCHLIDVLAQLVHALNFTQKAISHRRRPFHDFAFGDAIFLASYVIERRTDFLGRQQHVAFLGHMDHTAIANIVRCRSASAAAVTGRRR